jgi:hypothetical protein
MHCKNCDRDLPEDSFAIDKNRKRGRSYRCKDCQKKLSKAHFEKNKEIYRERNNRRMKALFEWLHDYKSKLKCEKCGYDEHPAALDFHHRDGDDKTNNISQLMSNTKSKEKTLEEIDKCMVLCAICHRILHYKENQKEKEMRPDT